jgi:hypothetical protein
MLYAQAAETCLIVLLKICELPSVLHFTELTHTYTHTLESASKQLACLVGHVSALQPWLIVKKLNEGSGISHPSRLLGSKGICGK